MRNKIRIIKLKHELENCINNYGLNSPITILKSQQLDKLIVDAMNNKDGFDNK